MARQSGLKEDRKMKRYFIPRLCLSLLFASLFGMAVSADDSVTVRVGVYDNSPKIFTDEKGNASGFWPDVLEYIASEEGWELEYIHGTWAQCLAWLEKNEIDIMPDVAYTEERSRLYDFSTEAVHTSWSGVYAKEEAEIKSILDLKGKTIAVMEGSVNVEGPDGIKALARKFDIDCTFTEVDSYLRVFELVKSGEADAGVTNMEFASQHKAEFNLHRTGIIFQPSLLYFAFPKESSLTPHLIARIDYHMKELKRDTDSVYYQSLEKWLSVRHPEKPVIPAWIIWLLISLGGLALLLAGGYFILRSQVRTRTRELTEEIAQRKQTEEALQQSENQFRQFFTNAPVYCYLVSPGGEILDVNRAAIEALGYEKEQLVGERLQKLYAPESAPKAKELFESWQQTGRLENEELTVMTSRGERRTVLLSADAVRDASGRILHSISVQRDITERKRMEDELRESEDKFAKLFRNSPDAITLTSLKDGRMVEANDGVLRISGYNMDEIIGHTAVELGLWHDPAGRQRFTELLQKQGRVIDMEVDFRAKSGAIRNCLVSAEIIELPDGKYILSVIRDITERKRIEEALQLRVQLLDNAFDSVFACDTDGKIIYINDTACRSRGYTKEEMLEMNLRDTVAPEQAILVPGRIRKATEEGFIPFESEHIRKDGSTFPVEVRAGTVKVGEETIILAVIRDITERKRAEEALNLRVTLLNSANDSITAADLAGNIVYANEAACRLRGYTTDEMLRLNFRDTVTPAQVGLVEERIKRVIKEGDITFESEHRRKDGSAFPVEMRMHTVKVGNTSLILSVSRDITERKQMEEQLMVTDRLASVGELAAGIAHELNNPLTGIIGYSELLQAKKLPKDIKDDLDVINREAKRTAQIVRNLLSFARQHPQEKQAVDVNKAIQQVLDLRAYEMRVHNIEVKTEFATDLPEITANGFQIQQVFLNIIINAEHFMIESHGRGTLTISTRRMDGFIQASLTDDGPGIGKDDLQHIFDPFFTTKEVGKGTGLGLSICHGIVTEHGGRIYAESKLGRGATFIVELPIKQPKSRGSRK